MIARLAIALLALQALGHGLGGADQLDCITQIRVGVDRITLEHRMIMSRPGAYAEVLAMDSDGDGQLSAPEQARYFKGIADRLAAGFDIRLNGQPVQPRPLGEVELEMPFAKIYRFVIEQPEGWQQGDLEFHNDAFLEASGSVQIQVTSSEQTTITYNSLQPDEPEQRDVVLRYRRGTGEDTAPHTAAQGAVFSEDSKARPRPLLLAAAALLLISLGCSRRARTPVLLLGVLGSVTIAISGLRSGQPVLNELEARRQFETLHGKIYAAFDGDSQEAIYDALATSLSGDLLEAVYLQIYSSTVEQEDGDVTVRIRRVKPLSSLVLPLPDPGQRAFQVRYQWRVIGTITHHAHKHARINEYQALYTVTEQPDGWRISAVAIEDQQRATSGIGQRQ
jgi:hypothetical protein